MGEDVYQELLTVMKSRRGPYAGLDIPEFFTLAKALFTPEEASINNALGKKPEPVGQIAEKLECDELALGATLDTMADKGLCATFILDGVRVYKGLPFMPGIFEYQFLPGTDSDRDRYLALLIHEYKKAYDALEGIEKISFPVTRVITVDKTIDAGNRVHTYNQVATYIEKYDSIGVGTCYCRHAAHLRGEDTHDMPMDVCFWFGAAADYMIERLGGKKLTKKEALDLLDRSEDAGLIHMSRNTTEDIEYLCNCDRWHCEVVTGVLKQPKPGWIFNSGYRPVVNAELCSACGTCIDRCPPAALSMGEHDLPALDTDRCFGCAVCATGCPEKAVTMEEKPDYPAPPKDVKELVVALKAASR